jgi:hypothetical protein
VGERCSEHEEILKLAGYLRLCENKASFGPEKDPQSTTFLKKRIFHTYWSCVVKKVSGTGTFQILQKQKQNSKQIFEKKLARAFSNF